MAPSDDYRKKAAKGDAEAIFRLAECYYVGRGGVDKDHAIAAEWFRKGAEKGHAPSMYWLGLCYRTGTGVVKSPANAIVWFQQAVDRGNDSARDALASLKAEEHMRRERERLAEEANRREKLKNSSAAAKREQERLQAELAIQREKERLAAETARLQTDAELDRLAREEEERKERQRLADEEAQAQAEAELARLQVQRLATKTETELMEKQILTGAALREQQLLSEKLLKERELRETEAQAIRKRIEDRLASIAPSDWTVDDTCAWLESINLAHLQPVFRQENVNGAAFLSLTDMECKALGITKLGDRKALDKRRNQLTGQMDHHPEQGESLSPAEPRPAAASGSMVYPRNDLEYGGVLSQNSFAAVYRAKLKDRDVTVKIFQQQLSDAQKTQLRNDANLVQPLPSHKHVLQFIGSSFDAKGIHLITEMFDGGNLDAFLAANPELPAYPRLTFCQQIASGMSHLEELEYVHGDLAARNVCLRRGYNEFGVPIFVTKIGETGFLRRVTEIVGKGTPKGRSDGSVRWQAPEVIKTGQPSTPGDVWSFGVVVWEIFAGSTLPYAHLKDDAAVKAAVSDGTEILSKPAACPDSVWKIAQPCFQPEAAERPAFWVVYTFMSKVSLAMRSQ